MFSLRDNILQNYRTVYHQDIDIDIIKVHNISTTTKISPVALLESQAFLLLSPNPS